MGIWLGPRHLFDVPSSLGTPPSLRRTTPRGMALCTTSAPSSMEAPSSMGSRAIYVPHRHLWERRHLCAAPPSTRTHAIYAPHRHLWACRHLCAGWHECAQRNRPGIAMWTTVARRPSNPCCMKGMQWESPRGPIGSDPHARDIVQNIYLRKVEKIDGELQNIEFAMVPEVKGPDQGSDAIAKSLQRR